MRFFGPERKYLTNGTRPMLNVGMSVLPNLSILPTSDNLFRISIMLPVRSNSCAWHEHTCVASEVPEILTKLLDDPEELFRTVFGWNGQGFSDMANYESSTERVFRAAAGKTVVPAKPVIDAVSPDAIDSDVF